MCVFGNPLPGAPRPTLHPARPLLQKSGANVPYPPTTAGFHTIKDGPQSTPLRTLGPRGGNGSCCPHTCRSRSRPGSAQLGRVQTLRAILTKPSPEPPRPGAPQAERQAGHASAGLGRNRLQLRFGAELYAAAQRSDGQIVEVGPYLFSKPGTTAPAVPNLSFVARVGELGCGVGYYKQGWVERRALRVVR